MLPNHLKQIWTRVVAIFTSHPDKSGLNVNYSMIFLECNIRNLYISAPEQRSKMRIAPLDIAWKTIFTMFFLISWYIMTYVYHDASKDVDISNIKKLAVWFSLQKEWGGSVGQIISNQGASMWFSRHTLENICVMIQLASWSPIIWSTDLLHLF